MVLAKTECRVYMAMELVNGGDVSDLVFAPRWLVLSQKPCGFYRLDGLAAVAEAGFIHRDIKPSNIFLTEEGSQN